MEVLIGALIVLALLVIFLLCVCAVYLIVLMICLIKEAITDFIE